MNTFRGGNSVKMVFATSALKGKNWSTLKGKNLLFLYAVKQTKSKKVVSLGRKKKKTKKKQEDHDGPISLT